MHLLNKTENDGAEENEKDGGEDEKEKREKEFYGGFVGELFGSLEATLADLVGLNAKNGTDRDAELVGLNEGIDDGADVREVDALGHRA